jgi:hypothetical protein
MPIILATREAEIKRTEVKASLGSGGVLNPKSTNGWVWWHIPIIPTMAKSMK